MAAVLFTERHRLIIRFIWNIVRAFIAIGIYYADFGLDIELVVFHYRRNHIYWATLTVIFVLTSSGVATGFSVYKYLRRIYICGQSQQSRSTKHRSKRKAKEKDSVFGVRWKIGRFVSHLILMPLVWRYIELIYYAKNMYSTGVKEALEEERKRYLESICDSCKMLKEKCVCTSSNVADGAGEGAVDPAQLHTAVGSTLGFLGDDLISSAADDHQRSDLIQLPLAVERHSRKVRHASGDSALSTGSLRKPPAAWENRFNREFRVISQITILESCVESAPQLILQLYIIMHTIRFEDKSYVESFQVIKVIFSALSVAFCAMQYVDLPDHIDQLICIKLLPTLQWCYLKMLIFFWNFFTISARLLAISLFVFQFKQAWMYIFIVNGFIIFIFVAVVHDLVFWKFRRPAVNCLQLFTDYEEQHRRVSYEMNEKTDEQSRNVTNNSDGHPVENGDIDRNSAEGDGEEIEKSADSHPSEMQVTKTSGGNENLPSSKVGAKRARGLAGGTAADKVKRRRRQNEVTTGNSAAECGSPQDASERRRKISPATMVRYSLDDLNEAMEPRVQLSLKKHVMKILFYIIIYTFTPVLREDKHRDHGEGKYQRKLTLKQSNKRKYLIYVFYYFMYYVGNTILVLWWYLEPSRVPQIYDMYCLLYCLLAVFVGMTFLAFYLCQKYLKCERCCDCTDQYDNKATEIVRFTPTHAAPAADTVV